MKLLKKNVHDKFAKKFNAIQTIDTSNLVKKTDYSTKISGIEKKIFNKLTAEKFSSRLK